MLGDHYVVKFTNDSVNPLNFQLCDMDLDGTLSPLPPVATAQILAYFAGQSLETAAASLRIVSVTLTPAGTNLGTLVPFPVAEYAAIRAAFGSLPAMAAYGVAIGRAGESLAPLGTSIVVTERTATGGPGGRGRHFLPFISENLIGGDGYVASTAIAPVEANYGRFIQDSTGSAALVDLHPILVNAAQTTQKNITTVSCQPVFSNLRSRRR